jgi:hypothetical protein
MSLVYPNLLKILSFTLISLVISSCSGGFTQGNEEALIEALIDEEYYRSLPLCDQIRIYAGTSPTNVDRGHNVKVMPNWVDNVIDSHSNAAIADCISEEGFRRLGLLERMSERRKEISLSIHALVYKAYNLRLFGYPQIQGLLDEIVCRSTILYPTDLASIYYLDKFGIPDFYGEQDASERMVDELCRQ